jgi:hypothetical protein
MGLLYTWAVEGIMGGGGGGGFGGARGDFWGQSENATNSPNFRIRRGYIVTIAGLVSR